MFIFSANRSYQLVLMESQEEWQESNYNHEPEAYVITEIRFVYYWPCQWSIMNESGATRPSSSLLNYWVMESLILFYVYWLIVLPVCIPVHKMCVVTMDTQMRASDRLKWSYWRFRATIWALDLKLDFLQEPPVLLTTEPCL